MTEYTYNKARYMQKKYEHQFSIDVMLEVVNKAIQDSLDNYACERTSMELYMLPRIEGVVVRFVAEQRGYNKMVRFIDSYTIKYNRIPAEQVTLRYFKTNRARLLRRNNAKIIPHS